MMADLALRLDVTGRRIVVLAGPGDRRDEDFVAIAKAVAGRFDHYICRAMTSCAIVPRTKCRAFKPKRCAPPASLRMPFRSFQTSKEAIEAALRMENRVTCC